MPSLILLGALLLNEGAKQSSSTQVSEESATVDWSASVIRAIGSGAPDPFAYHLEQAKFAAEKTAHAEALRNLLAAIETIPIERERTVGMAMVDAEFKNKVLSAAKQYRVVAQRYFSDGGTEIEVELSLAKLQLLVAPTSEGRKPPIMSNIEYSGVIINASSCPIDPVLLPTVFDSQGRQVYSIGAFNFQRLGKETSHVYVKTLGEARKNDRSGAHPFEIKTEPCSANRTDLILEKSVKAETGILPEALLHEGKVVFVVGKQPRARQKKNK